MGGLSSADLERWRSWIGRTETVTDIVDSTRAQALHATLDLPEPAPVSGDPLPPLWHWLYFWSIAPLAALGPDGHPARGGFLPPITLTRRMWAGSRVALSAPLPIGATARRRSTIADLRLKAGRSGQLVFLTVRHEISVGDKPCITDEQEIVYRAAAKLDAAAQTAQAAPTSAPWRCQWRADPVLLFRYSALTFNGHRIHYDRVYASEVEGYPGLVVHGPLLATLMVELARARGAPAAITGFAFRALRPVFAEAPFVVAGAPAADRRSATLWVADAGGAVAAQGQVDLAAP